MITPVWIIGFTGHRPKNSLGRTTSEMERLAPVIRAELDKLRIRAEEQHGRAELLCGLGAGADLIAAREAEALGMTVHVILPMPESLLKQDFDNEEDLRIAQKYIRAAEAGVGGATFRIAHGSQLRDDCYYDLGAQIVYASDAILALWDGIAAPSVSTLEAEGIISPGRGGTADIIDLAQADRMPYLKGAKTKDGYQWQPTPVRLINSVTGEVSGDCAHFARDDDAGLAEIKALRHAAETERGNQAPLTSAVDLMTFVDSGAVDWAKKLRSAMLWGVGLHFLASLIAAVSASAQETPQLRGWVPPQLAGVELVLVCGGIWLMVWAHLKHAQVRWLELRLAAELTRGLVAAGRLLDPLFPIATDHLPGWRRYCMSVGLSIWRGHPAAEPNLETDPANQLAKERAAYLKDRIEDQISHYGKYDPRRRHAWQVAASCAGPVLSVAAVVFIVIALLHKVEVALHPDQKHEAKLGLALLYYFLPIALPLLAGAIASLLTVTDFKRRSHVYPEMVERLRCASSFLPAIRTRGALRRFVRRTEEILLDELVGWYAAAKGISH